MNEFFNIFEYLTVSADIAQFVSLTKNIQDEKLFKQILFNQAIMIKMLQELKGGTPMKMLTNLIDRAEATMEEIEWYAEKAHHLKQDHRGLADTYIKIAEMHVSIYDMLHAQMILLIDQHKKEGHLPPAEMLAIWEYEHTKLTKHFTELKYMIEDYKKSY
jgi:hypothetical protein